MGDPMHLPHDKTFVIEMALIQSILQFKRGNWKGSFQNIGN
jgi:hypothetical protein